MGKEGRGLTSLFLWFVPSCVHIGYVPGSFFEFVYKPAPPDSGPEELEEIKRSSFSTYAAPGLAFRRKPDAEVLCPQPNCMLHCCIFTHRIADPETGRQLYGLFIPLIDGQAKCSLKVRIWSATDPSRLNSVAFRFPRFGRKMGGLLASLAATLLATVASSFVSRGEPLL